MHITSPTANWMNTWMGVPAQCMQCMAGKPKVSTEQGSYYLKLHIFNCGIVVWQATSDFPNNFSSVSLDQRIQIHCLFACFKSIQYSSSRLIAKSVAVAVSRQWIIKNHFKKKKKLFHGIIQSFWMLKCLADSLTKGAQLFLCLFPCITMDRLFITPPARQGWKDESCLHFINRLRL